MYISDNLGFDLIRLPTYPGTIRGSKLTDMNHYYDMKTLGDVIRWDLKKELERLHLGKMLSAYCAAKQVKQEHGHHGKTQPILPELPQVVVDKKTGKRYFRGRMLGKGGFARCYEVTEMQTDRKFACKAISKQRISKPHQKEKIANEVDIHKSIKSRFIVAFFGYFEDDDNVYILLELCSRKSMVQLLKQRRTLTEPEVRYFMHQAIQGIKDLHAQRIIHRDLKLGNLFLNNDMELRIGDFGLAVRVEDSNRKEMSVCGTPNYIAPEVLGKGGHSYEVDTWALGCVMYTLLVGRPPFETSCLKDTYMRIRNNEYAIPSRVSRPAAKLIQKLLSDRPEDRPLLTTVLQDDFFHRGIFPRSLPAVCCMAPPKFTSMSNSKYSKNVIYSNQRTNTDKYSSTKSKDKYNDGDINQIRTGISHLSFNGHFNEHKGNDYLRKKCESAESGVESQDSNGQEIDESFEQEPSLDLCNPRSLCLRITSCLNSIPDPNNTGHTDPISKGESDSEDEQHIEKPDLCADKQQRLWITKWVDYSNKYGFGAHLSNGCLVIRFNDGTTLALAGNKKRLQYFDEDRNLFRFSVSNIPEDLLRKVTLLNYFGNYMDKHLLKGGDLLDAPPCDDHSEIPIIDTWFRTEKAMVMYLTDGTLQVNFLSDHTKIILNPSTDSMTDDIVTYVNRNRESVTCSFRNISKKGCNEETIERLHYCRMVLEKLSDEK